MSQQILVSAGEASGDRYAARLVTALRAHLPQAHFFGCAGPEMRAAGVEAVVHGEDLAVVGLAEVLHHIPRIYGLYRRLLAAAAARRPRLAILTDSPDFHLRVAKRLHPAGIAVAYLVAPQAWAWREGRVKTIQRNVDRLFCIFPFEEQFFRQRGVNAEYIGHPLARLVHPTQSKEAFFIRHGLDPALPLVAICPGSRTGEARRHLPILYETARRLRDGRSVQFVLALPAGSQVGAGAPLPVVHGETWDALAHSTVALPASGTVTTEAALLGVPMVSYYRVTPLTWFAGRPFVTTPHFTLVNLIAGKSIIPELIQNDMTAARLTAETAALLDNEGSRQRMRAELGAVKQALLTTHDPLEHAAGLLAASLEDKDKV